MALVILAVIWTVYGYLWWQNRGDSRPGRSIVAFNESLALLGRAMESPVAEPTVVPRARVSGAELARQRRREVLQALAVAAGATLLLAIAFGGPFVLLHLVADLLLGGFVALLVRRNQLAAERSVKVIALPKHEERSEELVFSRSGT